MAVHPHIRGVYEVKLWILGIGLRSIPTYVGFTAAKLVEIDPFNGPSPHTWGLLPYCGDLLLVCRSIPTYVGFTLK